MTPEDPRPLRRIRMDVAYDGTAYHGWQVQPGLSTIQGELETILSGIEGAKVHVAGSGRTDAGVHALGQVAAVSLRNPIPGPNLKKAINRLLAPDIRILNAIEVDPAFHPRFDARAKTYEYRVFRGEICSPFDVRYVCHHPYPLREQDMVSAAGLLEGEHDFTAFAASDHRDPADRSNIRRIFSSCLTHEPGRLIYRVRGSGFLKHMVRNIVGVLFEVGKGNLTPEHLLARLQPHCGIPAGPTAPARGLVLVCVEY